MNLLLLCAHPYAANLASGAPCVRLKPTESHAFRPLQPQTPAGPPSLFPPVYAATAFSSHPTCPQWHAKVVRLFVSSQWVEQNFLPAGAMQLHAIWAHFTGTGVVDIVPPQYDQAPIFQECEDCTR